MTSFSHDMMTRGRAGVWIPPKNDDVIYEQPLINTCYTIITLINIFAESLHCFNFCTTETTPFSLKNFPKTTTMPSAGSPKTSTSTIFLACYYHFQQKSLILAEAISSALPILSLRGCSSKMIT